MKILRVHYNFDLTGGAEYDILKLIRVFEDRHIPNTLLLIRRVGGRYEVKDSLDTMNVNYTCNKTSEIERWIKNYIIERQFTLIHIHSLPYKEIVHIFFRLRLPVYKSMHEAMMICPGWGKFWLTDEEPCNIPFGKHCLLHAYTKKCTRSRNPFHLSDAYNYVSYEINVASAYYKKICVYSDYMATSAMAAGIPQHKICKIPSPQFFDDSTSSVNYEELPMNLLFAGRLSLQKGLHFLIHAIHKLKEKWNTISLTVIGDGQHKQYFIDLVNELGLEDNVRFIGWVNRNEVPYYYLNSRAVIIPSIYPDNFPNVVAEAMMYKRPVITFDVGGTAEWYEDGVSGLKVESKNIEQLAEKIDLVLSFPKESLKIGVNARNKILQNHSAEVTYQKYLHLYNSQE